MPTEFDDMDEADDEPLWASFTDGGYEVSESNENDEQEVIASHDGPLVGALLDVQMNAGVDGDSRVYEIATRDYDRNILFWGSAHIDSQVDSAGISAGTEMGVLKTGEVRETPNGEMDVFDVRYVE